MYSFANYSLFRLYQMYIFLICFLYSISDPEQILDLQQFIAFGINPFNKSVVALKSMQHFRAAFEPIAGRVVVCDSGALCTPDSTRFSFTRCRRPIFPIDQDFECFINIFK